MSGDTSGGSAFPIHGVGPSMTLRDWFAGQALAGLVVAYPEWDWEALSEACYFRADAMLEWRERAA